MPSTPPGGCVLTGMQGAGMDRNGMAGAAKIGLEKKNYHSC